ncbi:hypothetical protein JXA32_00645 [Candidatus Sumerlaeota bacterium]|nr:hypothetical protein [Candidatus Sumerlaeota bacterium]
MQNRDDLIGLICRLAAVPSFTTYEDRIHPLVREIAAMQPLAEMQRIPENNLLIRMPGRPELRPVALAAHLDKINHFCADREEPVYIGRDADRLTGVLDDSMGVGICLSLLLKAAPESWPPLYLLLSECEEGTGLREHPHLLRDGGEGWHHGIGAERLSQYLRAQDAAPALTITVDVTPKFQGKLGLAIYTNHWELNEVEPSEELVRRTEEVCEAFVKIEPRLTRHNNSNDYLVYGCEFNVDPARPSVSVALEAAVHPNHRADEQVHIGDILDLASMIERFLADASELSWLKI